MTPLLIPFAYRKDVDCYIEYLHGLPVRDSAAKALYPGEIEAKCEVDSLRNGVPIPMKVLEDMRSIAVEYGLNVEGYEKYLCESR